MGRSDICYSKDGSVGRYHHITFTATFNIYKAHGTTVLKRSQFGEFKKEASKEYPGAIIHDIDLKKIGGCDAFCFEWSGMVYGFRILTVQVQINPNEYLVVTLTGSDDRFEGLKKEFWNILSTFKPF